MNNEIIVRNSWILGFGENGSYSDLKLFVKKGTSPSLKRNEDIDNKDKNLLSEIEHQVKKDWIEGYEKKDIYLEIIILNVGIDEEGRKFAVENSVNGAMHMALPKIGVTPPQIFEL